MRLQLLLTAMVATMFAQQTQQVPPSGSVGTRTPVAPSPYQRPCGTVATDVCKVAVTIPRGATREQVYQMAAKAEQQGRKGEALSYLEKSAEMGYVRAQAAVGIDYANGKGEPRDPRKAVYWLGLAAAQGSRGAQDKLGALYENGDGLPRDQVKALRYYQDAAAQHDSDAEFALGVDYEFGRGLEHNRAKAIQYLRQSSVDGKDTDGADLANVLAKAPASLQFRSFDEIGAYLHPKSTVQSGEACNGVPTFTGATNRWGVKSSMDVLFQSSRLSLAESRSQRGDDALLPKVISSSTLLRCMWGYKGGNPVSSQAPPARIKPGMEQVTCDFDLSAY